MGKIGGNLYGTIQTKTKTGKNKLGEAELTWENKYTQQGWLDMQSADSRRNTYNAKIEDSTHIFICDFDAEIYALQSQDTRMVIKGMVYDVKFIDNPMEMDEQLEIYLKKVGAYRA